MKVDAWITWRNDLFCLINCVKIKRIERQRLSSRAINDRKVWQPVPIQFVAIETIRNSNKFLRIDFMRLSRDRCVGVLYVEHIKQQQQQNFLTVDVDHEIDDNNKKFVIKLTAEIFGVGEQAWKRIEKPSDTSVGLRRIGSRWKLLDSPKHFYSYSATSHQVFLLHRFFWAQTVTRCEYTQGTYRHLILPQMLCSVSVHKWQLSHKQWK